jgi:hypothetical protein
MAARKTRKLTGHELENVRIGIRHLKMARAAFKRAGAKRTLERVRLALASAGGAERHVKGLRTRAG